MRRKRTNDVVGKMAQNTFSAKGGTASAPSDIRFATLAKGGKQICRSYSQGG